MKDGEVDWPDQALAAEARQSGIEVVDQVGDQECRRDGDGREHARPVLFPLAGADKSIAEAEENDRQRVQRGVDVRQVGNGESSRFAYPPLTLTKTLTYIASDGEGEHDRQDHLVTRVHRPAILLYNLTCAAKQRRIGASDPAHHPYGPADRRTVERAGVVSQKKILCIQFFSC